MVYKLMTKQITQELSEVFRNKKEEYELNCQTLGTKLYGFLFGGEKGGGWRGWVYIILFENKNYETYNRSEMARDGQGFLQVMEHFVKKKLVIDFAILMKHW